MDELFTYLHNESVNSSFQANLSQRGGYITFSNSGRRGDTKYFQIGIDTILQTLKDILNNLASFSSIQDYEERPWRDNGSQYFTDPVANANSTVQTKPLFSTLSKVIKWANQPRLNDIDTDRRIVLSNDSLNNAIEKLNIVAESFRPHTIKKMDINMKFPLQQIYYGAPGTGKSFTIDNLTDDDNSVRTTFHPDTDYASFVGAYKPTMKDMPLSAFVGKEVHRAQPQGEHPGTEQRIVYKYVPQAFLKAYVAAWSKLDTPYYLIIEEINRGNCAQIFGDLFQLLDRNNSGSSSYAINADEDIAKFLKEDVNGFATLSQEQRDAIAAYELVKDNGEKRAIGEKILDGTLLLLPHNLHIWATMNTSDQSLFPIDSAFKRRWNWKYVPIDTNPIDKNTNQPLDWKFEVAGNLYSWGKFLELINPKVYDITESSDKQMGYFFAKADTTTGIISEEVFLNKVLFYLWTDVFKDYEVSDKIFNNKNKNNKPFRFTDFFEDAEALTNFIENCELESEEIEPQNAEDEEKQSRRKPYTSLSVSFPDGTIVKEDTIFGTFRSAIEKIGLDRIADFAKSAPVMRKGLPIIDTQEQQVLLDANYTYEQVGNYFVLKIKNVSYRKFLEEASKALNLNINITLE